MYCIHCGHPLDEGATFCGKCGKKQIPDDKKVYSPSAPARKSLVLPLIALCVGLAVVAGLVVTLMLALFGVIGPQSAPDNTRPVTQTQLQTERVDVTTKPMDDPTQESGGSIPSVTDPTEESDAPSHSGDTESTAPAHEDHTNIVDCISCGGSGDCVACKGEKYCPYCNGSGKELCYVCWGTDLCDQCMGAGKDTRGEKCRGCNGKGTCTFDTCTGGYEPCWKCSGQKPCYLCQGEGGCLTCGGKGSYDLNGPLQSLTAYRKVEHDDCWYGKTRCEGSYCNEGACSYQDCNGTGKLRCLSCEGSNECQTCTNNPRYEDRTCHACMDSGECSLCDGGYDLCYMCEGSGKCSTCNGIYEKDDRICIEGYQYEEYPYSIGVAGGASQGDGPSGSDHSRPVSPGGDCTKCGGDGWWCTRCDGSGDCNVLECVFGKITCSKCGGARSCNVCWLWTDSSRHCSACGDTGDCKKCGGEGHLKCSSCKGSGKCPTCKGDYWCDACDGSGFAG